MDDVSRRPAASIAARDAALARLWRLRRWLIVGSLAAAGFVAGVAAQAKPGKSSGSSSSAVSGASSQHNGGSEARLPTGSIPEGNSGSAALSPPPAAPAPAPATPAPTTSGGS